jgi:hypothetical protein
MLFYSRAAIIGFIYNLVNYQWVSKLDVLVGVYLIPLAIESVLLLLFLLILATRSPRRGRNLLVIVSAVILFFAVPTIFEALRLSTMPISPPPEVWEEGYYDALYIRSWTSMKAQIDAIILFFLSISYVWIKLREERST